MMLSLIPAMSFAVSAADAVKYIERTWDGEKIVETERECTDYVVVDANTTAFEDGNWYVVNSEVTVEDAIKVLGAANLILCNDCTLTVNGNVEVFEDSTLTIYGQSGDTGALVANVGSERDAGIGSDAGDCGVITIHGGTITAVGGRECAGIGGGEDGNGTVTINGGIVNATGGERGVGIGGSRHGNGVVTINGGVVNATGGECGPAIGGGEGGSGTVAINGGTVTAVCDRFCFSSAVNGTIELGSDVTFRAGDSAENIRWTSDDSDVSELHNFYYFAASFVHDHVFGQDVCTICGASAFVIEDGILIEYLGSGGDVVIPDGVIIIDDSVFWGCIGLTSVTIPASVTTIDGNAFAVCDNLTSVIIPEGVTTIGDNAFAACKRLTSVTIPASVKSIGDNAFTLCFRLTTITVTDSIPSIGHDAFLSNVISTVNYPCGNNPGVIKAAYKKYFIVEPTYNAIHDYSAPGVLVSEATCLKHAVFEAKCVGCDLMSGTMEIGELGDHNWQNATCTEPKSCTVCGITSDPALGHNFEDGVCTNCGIGIFDFDATSLSLSSALAFNFKGYLYDENPAEDAYMEFRIGNIRTENVPLTGAEYDEKGRYVFTCYLNELEVDEKIEAIFHDGEVTAERANPLSVTDYLDLVLERHQGGTAEDVKTVNLINAISNYAHFAQIALDETHDEYTVGDGGTYHGTAARTAICQKTADQLQAFAAKKTVADGFAAISSTSRTLVLDDETAIIVYLTPASGAYVPTVTVTDKDGNMADFTCEMQADGKYKIAIRDISAHMLADNYVVDVDDGKLTYTNLSALSYAYSTLAGGKSEAYKMAVSALTDYYLAAAAYIGGNGCLHTLGELIPEAPSTCAEEGLKAHYQCSSCGKIFDENKVETTLQDLVIEPKGHTLAAYSSALSAHWQECTVCGAQTDKEVHDFVDTHHSGEKECMKCGYKKSTITELWAFNAAVENIERMQQQRKDDPSPVLPDQKEMNAWNCIVDIKAYCEEYAGTTVSQQQIRDWIDEFYRLYNESIVGSSYESDMSAILAQLKQEVGY